MLNLKDLKDNVTEIEDLYLDIGFQSGRQEKVTRKMLVQLRDIVGEALQQGAYVNQRLNDLQVVITQ